MLIRQIRNANLVIDYAGVRLLTDPWLMDKGTGMLATSPWPENNMRRSPLVDLPCSVEEVVAGVQAVLVTHVHPDHFEADTVWYDEVAKTLERYRPEVTVLNCCGATLASWGASSWTRRTCLPCARRRHGRRWWPVTSKQ